MSDSKIQVPEYIKNAKIYGKSVVGEIVDNETPAFEEDTLTDEEINELRSDLKSNNSGTVKEKTTTDAISGVKNSTVDDEELDKIVDIINEQDIRGKTITNSGKAMIKDLLKDDPTEEELKHISEEFSNWLDDDDPHDMQLEYLESTLGERISNKIKEITDPDDYKLVMKRFALQLYSTYQKVVQYNDDMRQLSKIAKKVTKYNNSSENQYNSIEEFEKFNNEFKNLTDVQNDIAEFMNRVSNLDDRNKRLKNDYTIDDYDIRTVESVKKCLDLALSFDLIKTKVKGNADKFRKDYKDKKLVDRSIENWIRDIRNDPNTLFTFPVNDFLTLEESRIQMENYFYTAILHYNLPETIPDPEDEEIGVAMVKHGLLTNNDLEIYKTKARLTLYMLSRTFKHKKLTSDDDRRVLSYTLDIISKLGVHDHRDKLVNLMDYIYNTIFN